MKKLLPILILVTLVGCGGNSTGVSASQHAGIFAGRLIDASDGQPIEIETEQHVRGSTLNGTVRLTKNGKGYHGVLSGTVSGGSYSWHAKLGGGQGTIDATGAAGVGSSTLSFTTTSSEFHGGSGSISKTASAPTADLSGTYTLTWSTSLGDSNSLDLVVSYVNGQNVIAEQVAHLPAGGGYIIAGSVVGNTFASSQFVALGTGGSLTHFSKAPIGGSGTLNGQTFGSNAVNFTGTYSISSQPNH